MKKTLTLFMLLISLTLLAQDKIFLHTVTNDNIVPGNPNSSYIDYPDLNNNPTAKVVVKQSFSPNDVLNDHAINLFYFNNKWTINNSDFAPLPIGASFNVFIGGSGSTMVYHTATSANTTSLATAIDNPLFNGQNPGPSAVFSSVYTSGAGIVSEPLGFDYTGGKRRIYVEDLVDFPLNTNFNIVIPSSDNNFTHISTAGNISGAYTIIDNPLLNDNPNTSFVFEHYYGLEGQAHDFPHNLGLSYAPSLGRWIIFTEDLVDFIPGLAFTVITAPQTLGIENNTLSTEIAMYPNPAKDFVTIKANDIFNKISVFNTLGQEIFTSNNDTTELQLDLSNWKIGTYFVKVESENGLQTLKLIKN